MENGSYQHCRIALELRYGTLIIHKYEKTAAGHVDSCQSYCWWWCSCSNCCRIAVQLYWSDQQQLYSSMNQVRPWNPS